MRLICLRLTGPVAFSLVIVALSFGVAVEARANSTAEELGASSSVLGQMGRFAAQGADAVLFAPSLLVLAEDNMLMGMTFLWQNLDVDLMQRPAGADVASSVLTSVVSDAQGNRTSPGFKPLPTASLVNGRGSASSNGSNGLFFFGTVKRFLDKRLAFGFYSILPMSRFQSQRPFYVDERQQYFSNSLHFERYGDTLEQNAFVFALSGRPFDWLTVGAGVTFTNFTQVSNSIYMPDTTRQQQSSINGQVVVNSRLVPHGSVTFLPLEKLRLTATFHAQSRSSVKGESRLQFWNFNYPDERQYLQQGFEGSYGFSPMRLGFGGWWADKEGDLGMQLAAGATYSFWSDYVDHHGDTPVLTWSNTLTVVAGGALRVGDHEWGLDFKYEPTPVPIQDGRSNYVDNDRLGLSFRPHCLRRPRTLPWLTRIWTGTQG